MHEVALLMRSNLSDGLSIADFGAAIGWGTGDDIALNRRATLTVGQLELIGLTVEQALNWSLAYRVVKKLMPDNPSAFGRAELMEHAATLLSGA